MAKHVTAAQILNAAITLAEKSSWEDVRLHHIAAELGIGLNQIRQCFQEKEVVADAWFDQADAAMLKLSTRKNFQKLKTLEQIHMLIMAWLNALAKHKHVTREIIVNKLELGHLHVQIPAILRISRTVQWLREAAHRDATSPERALDETVLSAIFVMTFVYWLNDHSTKQEKTDDFLRARLAQADYAKKFFDSWQV